LLLLSKEDETPADLIVIFRLHADALVTVELGTEKAMLEDSQ
jgi:hypothetical protein